MVVGDQGDDEHCRAEDYSQNCAADVGRASLAVLISIIMYLILGGRVSRLSNVDECGGIEL